MVGILADEALISKSAMQRTLATKLDL
jgi:hypothetical protein